METLTAMATVGIINNVFSPRKSIEFGLVAALGREISMPKLDLVFGLIFFFFSWVEEIS